MLSKIVQITKAKPSGSGYLGHCPAHEDSNPSLSITQKDDKILLHCHRGCSQLDVITALKSQQAWHAQTEPTPPVQYVYTDEEGTPIYIKFRYFPKNWSIKYYQNGELKAGGLSSSGTRRVLYNLAGIEKAKADNQPIFFVEGEKDAETLIKLGFCATTTDAGAGAGKAKPELLESLAGLNVIVMGDNDEVGLSFSDELEKSLAAVAKQIQRIILPSQVDGKPTKDITDYLNILGHEKENVYALMATAKHVYPIKLVYSYADLLDVQLPEPQTWLGGFVAPGEATLIVAMPGVGKTWFTMSIAQVLADGARNLGHWKPKKKVKTLIVDFEMSPTRIRERLEKLRKGYGLKPAPDEIGILCPELCLKSGITFNDLGQAEQRKLLHDALVDYDLVIVDNINAAYPNSESDENSPKFWEGPQNFVMSIRRLNKGCIFVHHATKGDPKNPAGSAKNTRFFDNVLALCDITDYAVSDVKKIKVHIRKSRNFPLSRENQPELELQDVGSGSYWAVCGEQVSSFQGRKDLEEEDSLLELPF